MNQTLPSGFKFRTPESKRLLQVEELLGSGGQGEVYGATLGGEPIALKWYFERYLQVDPELRARLQVAIDSGPPNECFLWPMEVVATPDLSSFGYIMPMREPRFCGIIDLLRRRVDTSFYVLATAGFELANSYWQLHAQGLCYRDISFGNVFFDPQQGDVRVCDNDNVDINGRAGAIAGTPGFMAPEIVRGEAMPSAETDLFSLSVLLFYMLVFSHPLQGKREAEIECMDLSSMRRLYGTNPLFIFDPNDRSNEPVPGRHDNALRFWPIFPQFIRDRFTKAFTDGIVDPRYGRVRETEWRAEMIRLRDCVFYCSGCGSENFYQNASTASSGAGRQFCWACKGDVRVPPRLHIGKRMIMLNDRTKIYPHHLEMATWDFREPVAEVLRHPSDSRLWGLRNLMNDAWRVDLSNGETAEVKPGRSLTLAAGTTIHFGKTEGTFEP